MTFGCPETAPKPEKNLIANLLVAVSGATAFEKIIACLLYDSKQGVELVHGDKLREVRLSTSPFPTPQTNDKLAMTKATGREDLALDAVIAIAFHFHRKRPLVKGLSAPAAIAFVHLKWKQ